MCGWRRRTNRTGAPAGLAFTLDRQSKADRFPILQPGRSFTFFFVPAALFYNVFLHFLRPLWFALVCVCVSFCDKARHLSNRFDVFDRASSLTTAPPPLARTSQPCRDSVGQRKFGKVLCQLGEIGSRHTAPSGWGWPRGGLGLSDLRRTQA